MILQRAKNGVLVWPEGAVPGSPEIRLGPWAPSQVDLGSFPPLAFPLHLPLDWVFCPAKGFGTIEGLLGALGVRSLKEDLLRQPMEGWQLHGRKGGGESLLFLLRPSRGMCGTGGLGLPRPACTNPSAMSA